MAGIICENVTVSLSTGSLFRSVDVIKRVSFEVRSGDRIALIGPNGAGKSTLLMALAQILPPRLGRIDVDGDVSALFNLSVGLNRQSTGRRNMVLRNLIQGRSMKEIRRRLPEMIKFADIGDYIDLPLETYSQGMAMRVVFSAATEFAPDVLLMDEWLGVGDQAFREKSNARMNSLVESSGMLVLATHHQRLSRDLCNLGLYLDAGEVKYFGDIDRAWDAYLGDSRARATSKPDALPS